MFVEFMAAQHRLDTIERIPPYLISVHEREELRRRAKAGEDVRAYSQWDPRLGALSVGVWYLWDGEALDPDTGEKGWRKVIGMERI